MSRPFPTSGRAVAFAAAVASGVASVPRPAGAQGASPDSSAAAPARARHEPLFTRRDIYVTLGASAATALVMQFDRTIANNLRSDRAQTEGLNDFANSIKGFDEHRFLFTSAGMFVAGRVFDWVGVRGARGIADAGLHATEANAISTLALVAVMRGVSGRSRPAHTNHQEPFDFEFARGWKTGPYRSFPSLHSTGAFSFAGAMTAELRRHHSPATKFVAPLLFGTATMVGLGRMYQDQHWASDVLSAAFVGTAVGMKTVKWHHAHEGNRYDRWMLGVAPMPGDGQLGLVLGRRW